MHYTRRVGEYEETFEGTPEEISEVMKVIDSQDLHQAAANIKPAPFIVINADGKNMLGTEEIGKAAVKAVNEHLRQNVNAFDDLRDS
ncbi:hypothetical protein ACP2W0_08335 [Pseudobacillus badius]|uniref:hypothetical protein n=1 Tax=Bacillus badius TaxID=1455 RepID=UPI001CBD270C|nr:hypothetical protein [Bacillus badius]UAT31959.1 hypothetical protein K7T73_06995 [Bacillus badius]